MKNKLKENWAWIVGAIFIFCLFYKITSLTPWAGDDWVYSVNASGNPFWDAWKYYSFWSGRYMAEVFSHLVVLNKSAWNVFNAFQFSFIFICLYWLIQPQKNRLLVVVCIIAMMLGVKDQVRMQTYTFAMGACAYITPLLFGLPYFLIAKKWFVDEKKGKNWEFYLAILLNLVGAMFMQNWSVAFVTLNIGLCVLAKYLKRDQLMKKMMILTLVSLISFLFILISPGNQSRMLIESPEWLTMSLFSKIWKNWGNFINYTFLEHKVLILTLVVCMIGCALQLIKKDKKLGLGLSLFHGLVLCYSLFLAVSTRFTTFFVDGNGIALLLNTAVYLCFTLVVFVTLIKGIDSPTCWVAVIALAMGGIANASMMVSPIFAHRNAVYLIFMVIVVIGIVLSKLEISKLIYIGGIVLFVLFCEYKVKQWDYKYTVVDAIQKERLVIIQYYRDNPELTDIYIPRMPEYTIHSADIEPEDSTHQLYFKRFYGLNDDATIYMFWGDLSK